MGKFSGSMLYTIGTALDRARENGHDVEVLVDGTWLRGSVVANDGTGVVLENEGEEFSVIRLERVSAVRVIGASPQLRRIRTGAEVPRQQGFDDRAFAGAMPMPGPGQER